jgi:hypothetical protein
MKHLLSSTAFLIVNKRLAKRVGLKAAVLLADLISKEQYFIENKTLVEGHFFNTETNIFKDTTLSPYQQRKAVKTLKKENLIETKRMGVPAKIHFKINEEQVVNFLKDLTSNKSTTINNNKQIKINNTTIDISIRLKEFEEKVYNSKYSTELCNDFCEYWTETNPKGTKMKFEMQKTFDIGRRLSRWAKNDKTWNKTKTSKIDAQLNNYEQAKKHLGL